MTISIQITVFWDVTPSTSCKLLLAFASTLNLGFGTHVHIFVLSKLLRVLKWGIRFDDRRDLITIDHSQSTGE
jgi:hypothetical protein